ncbi:MAG: tRNA (adenosine(37)-N6)-threonylcarbamoyltransferase complex dimerization subunit type 1 TsaB [Deltaproteobacteria bacterium]
MFILAIDTSTSAGSVAVVRDGRTVSERSTSSAPAHAEWLMPAIRDILAEARITLAEIGFFVVTAGPGSFTGLRIGISAAKGLAWRLKKKAAQVSTLESMAMNIQADGALICPVLDARKHELYAAAFRRSLDGMLERVMEDSVMPPDVFISSVKGMLRPGEGAVFLGIGLLVYGDIIKAGMKDAVFAPASEWRISASNAARLAWEKRVELIEPARLSPVYLRKSEAELRPSPPKP